MEKFLHSTSSGGVTVNDIIKHAGIPDLPFGGVGNSGIGNYHGKHGFIQLSHAKAVLKRRDWTQYLEFEENEWRKWRKTLNKFLINLLKIKFII